MDPRKPKLDTANSQSVVMPEEAPEARLPPKTIENFPVDRDDKKA